MASSISEPSGADSPQCSGSQATQPHASPPVLESLMSSTPCQSVSPFPFLCPALTEFRVVIGSGPSDWPLGPTILRLRRALHRTIPLPCTAPDRPANGPTAPVPGPDQPAQSLLHPSSTSPQQSSVLAQLTVPPPNGTPSTPFTPELGGSFGLISSNSSAFDPRSLPADSSLNPHVQFIKTNDHPAKPSSLPSPPEPSHGSLVRHSVVQSESSGAQDAHSYDESLDGTPIFEDERLTHMEANPPPPAHFSPACQVAAPPIHHAPSLVDHTTDSDLDGLPMYAERAQNYLKKKRAHYSDESPVLDSKKRKMPSNQTSHDQALNVSIKDREEEEHPDRQDIKTTIPEDERSLTAWLDSCIAPVGPPSSSSPTFCSTDINIPQLLEAIRDAKASSSRLRSEGFVGDEAELEHVHAIRKPKPPPLLNVHKDRLTQCAKWPKGDQLNASPTTDENAQISRRRRVSQSFDPKDPFPLDGYITGVIKKIVSQFWNQYIVEAFCRVGLWLEKQGVWEHGNWGTLLSNELARFIDIGGKGRLADMLAYHRPKPFEEILLISSQMHLLELSRDGGLMRVRLSKDFTPRGLFYRPLIRGLRLWTYEERTPVADRNRLEYEYATRFTESGDVTELLPPHTSFRKYTHWAATENVIVMIPKDKPKVITKGSDKEKYRWNAKDDKEKFMKGSVRDAHDKISRGGPKEIKLTPPWVSREYKNEPAPTCKLEPSVLKEIEDLISKSVHKTSVEPKKAPRRWSEARNSH